MKKRIVSIMCMAVFAAVMTFACIGTVTAEASQQGTTAGQEEELTIDGPYVMETLDGQLCFQCEFWNYSDDDIYVAMTFDLFDASYANVGSLCAFNPCIGPNEGAILYVIDYEGVYDSGGDVSYMIYSGYSNYTGAEEELYSGLTLTEQNGYIQCSAVNLTSEIICQPEISFVFYSSDYSEWWVNSVMLTEPGTYYLDVGSAATANIAVPDGYDDWYYCINGFYYPDDIVLDSAAAAASDSAAAAGADSAAAPVEEEDNSYFSSNYFRSSDMSSVNSAQDADEDLGQN